MRNWIYPLALIIAFIMSQMPLYLSSVNAVYTSYCDTDAWFTLQRCLLDPINSIIGSTFFFIITFVLIVVLYKLFVFIKNKSD